MSQYPQISDGVQPNQSGRFLRRSLWQPLVLLVRAALRVLSPGPAIYVLCATVCFAETQLNAPAAATPTSKAIGWSQVGATADAKYPGDVLKVTPTQQGARVHCAFQHLDGEATREGLWLTSTAPNQSNDGFCVKAVAVGRTGGAWSRLAAEDAHKGPSLTGEERLGRLSATGEVAVESHVVRFMRPGLVEEYTVSMDGVRQDFLVLERPGAFHPDPFPIGSGEGVLCVELAVSGARVVQTAYGAQLVLEQSGRQIAYSRVKVTDAKGKELPARIEAVSKPEIRNPKSETGLVLVVDEAEAVYPVRIDPTFSDANWSSLGGIPGANGTVHAAVVDGAGNLYVGGEFTLVGDVPANNIAKWDGVAWSALGLGITDSVRALAVSGSNVYAGGAFTMAGGIAATNIAKWNGSTWGALGLGVGGGGGDPFNPPTVYALAVSGGNVYAGGNFTNAGNSSAGYIAKWDGSAWSALGLGLGGGSASYPPAVFALAVSGSDVYVGGDFTMAGGVAASYIARWDGSIWSALGPGVGGGMPFTSGGVRALAVSGSNLYAGGYFTTAGGNPATTIARWDGTAWSALGSGTGGGSIPPYDVTALAVSGNDLYACWTTNVGCAAGGCSGGGGAIAKWNGSTWSPLGPEPGGVPRPAVYALAASGSNLFAGGYFTTAGDTVANYVARWDGTTWSALGAGMGTKLLVSQADPRVMALAVSGTNLYAGGNFVTTGDRPANYIARWNGSAWSPLGSGVGGSYNSSVYGLAVSGDNLYVGGDFTRAGDISVYYVAKWDGTAWSALGSGLNYTVFSVVVSGSNVYAGGGFTMPGGIAGGRVAKWDGTAWNALGLGMDDSVYTLAVSGTNLYAAGYFTTAGGIAANHIAKWNGSAWSALGSGLNSPVVALAVSGSNLYAGGYFTTAGGSPANSIAKWDGSTWTALGSGVGVEQYASVTALAVSGNDLYAGGSFTTAGGTPANSIAKWDGSGWSALGSGVGGTYNPTVFALAGSGDALYAGGAFTIAGGKVSAYAAKAVIGPPPFYFVTTNSSIGFTNGQFSFTLSGPPGSNAVIFASSNLQTWTPLVTNPLAGGSLNFTDTLATNFTRRFYRALLQP